ncbi:hypothetical protein [Pseudomonas sp. EMN2]|uniref:hypothetical protein n=1 Tax=Pseudomonas sp. EMN2 TaxID=2615212 RepID=UPI0015B3F674|nr:hypothetical protein [Pseudomonas sp. EMN2]
MNEIIIPAGDGKTERIESSTQAPAEGQWYWVSQTPSNDDPRPEWLACATRVGSNFVEVKGPSFAGRYSYQTRIHMDDVPRLVRPAPEFKEVIGQRTAEIQAAIASVMHEMEELTHRLGVGNSRLSHTPEGSGTGLAVLSGVDNLSAYKQQLIAAKDTTLPELQKLMKDHTENLARWLQAEVIPFEAQRDGANRAVKLMEGRILNVELYGGLAEHAIQFAEGEPAAATEKLRVFQRLLFCDEEALLRYHDGGMDISDMASFRGWLALPENRDRILPYDRCMVAMRVRRKVKERDWGGNLRTLFKNLHMNEADKYTYLFIRNGGRLYQVETAIDFDELIFPSKSVYDPSQPMMVNVRDRNFDKRMPRREYDDRVEKSAQGKKSYDQWAAENPGRNSWDNPHRNYEHFDAHQWHPLDSSSVYFDDAMEAISDEVQKFNRVAVIIQGIFDRSECLVPHPRVRSWTAEGFREAIQLVYDGDGLVHGEAPDFRAYVQRCNTSITSASVLVGQEHAWQERETKKECDRIDRDRRSSSQTYRPKLHTNYGDPGPGYLALPESISGKRATFTWFKERLSRNGQFMPLIAAKVVVPFDKLFNVSAYQLGDYLMFFRDPRTRERYLEWAPMLIAAEEYHRGTKKAQAPGYRDPNHEY